MANIAKHKKVSGIADSADTSIVRPSDWNDEHVFAGGNALEYLMWSAGASDKVAFDNIWARLPFIDITKPPYSADNTGVADVTSVFQAAIAAGGIICLPPGDYKITATLTITNAIHIFGIGAGPGGTTSGPDSRYKGAVINHHFNGTLFDIPGINNNVIGPVGTIFENLVLRQTYGNGSAAAGAAIRIVGTSSNFRATWVKVHNVNIESDLGATDSWTYGVYIDGSGITTGGIGSRDHFFENMRISTDTHSVAGVYALAATNSQWKSILINGTPNADFILSGSAGAPASLIKCWAVACTGAIETDFATGVQLFGCSCDTLSISANSTSVEYWGSVSGAPAISNGAIACFAYSAGAIHYSGDNNRLFKFYAGDGNQTRLGIDSDAAISAYLSFRDNNTEKWTMGKTGSDLSFFLTHATVGNVYTIDPNGVTLHNRGTRRATTSPTYGTTVTVNCYTSDMAIVVVTNNTNFDLTASNLFANQILHVMIFNNSGGAMGTITWDASIFRLAGAFVNPATGQCRTVTFRCSGTRMQEISRTAADVTFA